MDTACCNCWRATNPSRRCTESARQARGGEEPRWSGARRHGSESSVTALENWPDPVQRASAHINPAIYVSMQGPSELGISGEAKLANWECTDRLATIETPTLVIGATHDTIDPTCLETMS